MNFVEILAGGTLVSLVHALVNFGVVLLCLRGLDKLSGVDFKSNLETMREDPKALANYYAGRFVACGLAAGLAA